MKDHYRTLGLTDKATDQEIKVAYRQLAKRYHPDVNPGNLYAEERFKEISEAYNILSDPILRSAYDARKSYRAFVPTPDPFNTKEPNNRGRRKRTYNPEELERVRARNKMRTEAVMQKRKKLLKGMIITFALYLVATFSFEEWIEHKRQEESEQFKRELLAKLNSPAEQQGPYRIKNLDSPYDRIFGSGVTMDQSPNSLIILNKFKASVICVTLSNDPQRTIRNEYIEAGNAFAMRELPNGSFLIKVYAGDVWDTARFKLQQEAIGGFRKDEGYYLVNEGPFVLQKPTYENPDSNTSDTLIITGKDGQFIELTPQQFFGTDMK